MTKEDGDLTESVEYTGEVKVDVVGDYQVTYKVSDKNGQVVSKLLRYM